MEDVERVYEEIFVRVERREHGVDKTFNGGFRDVAEVSLEHTANFVQLVAVNPKAFSNVIKGFPQRPYGRFL